MDIVKKEYEGGDSQIVLYQPNETVSIEVKLDAEYDTVWLSIDQMAQLFGRDKSVIGKHVRAVFKEGELQKDSVWAKFAYTASDGKTYQVDYYNLDVIISVVTLLVDTLQRLVHFLGISLSTADKVSEKDCIIYNLNMESEESPVVAYADAIDVAVADKLLAVGDVFNVFGILDFCNYSAYRVKHLAGKLLDRLLKILGIFYIHTPSQFSKSFFSCWFKMTCPSGRSLLSLA